jgi:hypothetical protein
MAYLQTDDQMPDHPKVAALSDAAFRLHFYGMSYSARLLTDGKIDADAVPTLVRKFRPSALKELVDRGMWYQFDNPPAYVIHDYLDHNPSKEVVLERRAKAAARAKESRESKGSK